MSAVWSVCVSAQQGLDSGWNDVCVCACVLTTLVYSGVITAIVFPNFSDSWTLEWTDARCTLQYNPI